MPEDHDLGDPNRVMTAIQAQRERMERLRAVVAETIRTSRDIVEESNALLAKLDSELRRPQGAGRDC